MQMQAAILNTPGQPLSIDTVTLDAPAPGEVRVKVAASGVYATVITI